MLREFALADTLAVLAALTLLSVCLSWLQEYAPSFVHEMRLQRARACALSGIFNNSCSTPLALLASHWKE